MMSKEKVIVVLGASRGIGASIVKIFAQNNDFQIIALSRNLSRMQEQFEAFDNVYSYAFDLSSVNVREKAEEIFTKFKKIDILINNAGALVNKPFAELSHDDISLSFQVNIIGIMGVTQAAVGFMSQAHIVNISSIGGFQGSVKFSGLSAYSTSKAALCGFTELFAEEYKDTAITMNCLCLGAVQTEMLEEAFPGYVAPLSADEMASYITEFALNGNKWMNGKIIPVSLTTP